jgi:hypothetical protein
MFLRFSVMFAVLWASCQSLVYENIKDHAELKLLLKQGKLYNHYMQSAWDSWQPQKLKTKCLMCRLLHAWSTWRILRWDGSSAWARWQVGRRNTTISGFSAFKLLSTILGIIIITRTWLTSNVCENFWAAGFSFRYQSKDIPVNW